MAGLKIYILINFFAIFTVKIHFNKNVFFKKDIVQNYSYLNTVYILTHLKVTIREKSDFLTIHYMKLIFEIELSKII